MERVTVALRTPLPRLANELLDVLKLFYAVDGFAVNAPVDGAEALLHEYGEEAGAAWCAFGFRGERQRERAALPPDDGDPAHQALLKKRVVKRLCKLTLYALLKRLTGFRPPWGSLTGIRPTRLLYENLALGMTLAQAAQAVQDVYDVSAEKAALLGRIVERQQAMTLPREDEADVYVSVPFCRTRCAYCSFPGEAIGKGALTGPYLEALFWEMARGAELMKKRGLRLRALYVGGGTPTALSERDFARLMGEVTRLFPDAREVTVEAGRPDTITRGKLQTLLDAGVHRVSVNPQTMNDRTLRLIGRDHTAAQTVEAFRMARDMGFEDINMDVIAGLPGEGADDFAHTMEAIRALGPDSLTVHTLAIKRSSRLNLERAPLPDADTAARMVLMGEESAAALGLGPYYLYRQKYMAGQQQNVGYARRGMECLYNVDIMEENASILAFGAGAISKRVFPDRERRIERAPNVSNVAVYVGRVQDMAQRKEALFTEGGTSL